MYQFTILQSRITKSLLPEHQQHLEAVYDDGQPEFYEQTEVLLKVGQTSCRTFIIRLCLQFDQMKRNTIQVSDGKMR